jgi:hypothetical protein
MVQATVIMIAKYNSKTFIVQATEIIIVKYNSKMFIV